MMLIYINSCISDWTSQLRLTSVYSIKQSYLNQLYYYCHAKEKPLLLSLHSSLIREADKKKVLGGNLH